MTCSVKIKHTGPDSYAIRIDRQGEQLFVLQPGEEADVTLWSGAPLLLVEQLAKKSEPSAQ